MLVRFFRQILLLLVLFFRRHHFFPSPNGELSLAAVLLSRVILLGSAEIQRVSARVVARPRVRQRAGHFVGVDRQDEAATGVRL